jgi:hypothetical protein
MKTIDILGRESKKEAAYRNRKRENEKYCSRIIYVYTCIYIHICGSRLHPASVPRPNRTDPRLRLVWAISSPRVLSPCIRLAYCRRRRQMPRSSSAPSTSPATSTQLVCPPLRLPSCSAKPSSIRSLI